MRILYAGSPAPSAKVLDHLAQSKTIEVVGVITQPDKRRKRRSAKEGSAVANVAEKHKLTILKPHKLDEEFKETVKSRNRDTFDYNNFSEGEKMRIDLALVFTWRAIAKMKNSANTNLMVLDEIFDSSLDGQGTDDFFKIVNKMGKENIFIISHKGDILFDKFTNIIKFEKEHNFTRLQNV